MPLSNVKPAEYQRQLDTKATRIAEQFAVFDAPAPEVFDSPPLHFRQRAEFRVWHEGGDSFYVMFHPDAPKVPVRIDDFTIGSETMVVTMRALMQCVRKDEALRQRLFQVEFLTTLSGEVLVTLIYHRALDEAWRERALALQATLGIKMIGRSRKQRWVLSEDYVTETLMVNGHAFYFQQIENSFTQPNARVNEKMLGWAQRHSRQARGDLLELYCGNGNFTAVLARNFRRVLATEISKTSVRSARLNFSRNGVDNVDIVRMSSEDLAAAFAGVRAFRRLREIDLGEFNFSTVLVDPPRAGLDAHTLQLVAQFDTILYISCNPHTLFDNLQTLHRTHSIEQFAIFDQFPYTGHIECGVRLVRRQAR